MQDKKTLLTQKWIEALESGERQQSIGYRDGYGGRCAFGVFDDVKSELGFKERIDWQDFLNVDQNKIWYDNDVKRLTFSEIAAKLKNGQYDLEEEDVEG